MSDFIPAWKNGRLTPVEKLTAHLEGLRHKAVSVFVIHDGQILIQRRAPSKYHTPNLWANTCCTHPHWDEDPRVCAVRRLEQELGLTDVDPVWKDRIEYQADVGNDMVEHEVVDLFVATPSVRPAVTPNPDEVSQTRWISLGALVTEVHDVPHAFTPWFKIYLDQHRESVFGPA